MIALRTLASICLTGGAICAGSAVQAASTAASGDACVALFQRYDAVQATMSTPHGAADRMPIPPSLQFPVTQLQSAGCMTLTNELTGMASADGRPVADGGPALVPPSALHVGVVTNSADEANAVGFFQGRGIRVRTVGAPGLGRRIYVGPFATEGALSSARDLALAAGFSSPYPANF